ncbi:MAG: DinB family protein [Vicinamibacterales bacterium]
MKRSLSCLLALLFVLASSTRSTAQGVTIAGDVLKDWVGQKSVMMKIAAEMPDDKFGYKSTPAQRTFAEQVLHVATVNVGLMRTLGAKAAPPTINDKATAKADVLKALGDSFDYGEAALKEFSDAQMLEAVMGPRFIGQATRARIAFFTIAHSQDIYGQLVVYLRLNGHVPPASQRP